MRRLLATGAGVLLLALALDAGEPPQEHTTPSDARFRVETRLVEVDVFVTARDGTFVPDLDREAFTLFENGERREIVGLSVVHLPARGGPHRADPADPAAEIVTNASADGRLFVLVIGQIGYREGPRVQSLARRFVEHDLQPGDRAAVVHVGRPAANQAFTNRPPRLLASIDEMCGRRFPLDWVQRSEPCAAAGSDLAVLGQVLHHLREAGGRRTSVLFVSSAAISEEAADELARVALSGHVTIYVLDPEGLPPATTDPTGESAGPGAGILRFATDASPPADVDARAGRRRLAERTGGVAITGSNNWSQAMARAVTDAGSYYVLGYYPAPDTPGDGERRIDVQVARDDVAVRARRTYMPPWIRVRTPPSGPAPVWDTPIASGVSPEIPAALGNPFPFTELPIELFVSPFRHRNGLASVVIGAHLSGQALRTGPGMRVEVAHAVAPPEGPVVGIGHAFTLIPSPSERAAIAREGLRFLDRVELSPGRHEIRFAASQLGVAGSLAAHIEVPDFAAHPLTMSGLVVASTAMAAQPTLQMDARVHRAMGVVPTTRRAFAAGDTLVVYGEVYVNGSATDAAPAMGAALTAGGLPVRQAAVEIVERDARDATRWPFVVRVPLEGLEAGAYLLSVEANAPDAEATARQVAFRIATD